MHHSSSFKFRRTRHYVVALAALLGTIAVCAPSASAQQRSSPPPRARVLLVRGGFTVFSLGLNTLADELERLGYQVDVAPASLSASAASQIAHEFELYGRQTLVIIGHSLGGDLTPHLARYFESRQIPVKLAVLLDSPLPSSVPGNVERCVNIYNSRGWSAPVLGGRATSASSNRTEVVNIDLGTLPGRAPSQGIDHFSIDASPWVHQVVIRAVRLSCESSVAENTNPNEAVKSSHANQAPRVPEPPRQADSGPQFRR